MAIKVYLGNVGSGKTACAVRDMALDPSTTYYSNILSKLSNVRALAPEMICTRTELGAKRSGEKVYQFELNSEYWKTAKKPLSVVLDEAHNLMDARRAMSKVNILMNGWLALLRRTLGEDSRGAGDLVLITQLDNRLDVIARDMAHQVKYHVCHWLKVCGRCHAGFSEHSNVPEPLRACPRCGSQHLTRRAFQVEVWAFQGIQQFYAWKLYSDRSFYAHYFVNDIEKYFPLYDTLQWDSLLKSLYT